MSTFEETFRAHFQKTYAESGRPYEAYAPAYLFGRVQAVDARFAGRGYAEAEEDLRALYDLQQGSERLAYPEAAEAVRCGYEAGRDLGPRSKGRHLAGEHGALAELDRLQITSGGASTAETAEGMAVGAPPQGTIADASSAFREHAARFRTHYRETYASQGREYALFEPAYRFGYEYARRFGGQGLIYEDAEPELRRLYQERYPDSRYEQVQEAVRFAYEYKGA